MRQLALLTLASGILAMAPVPAQAADFRWLGQYDGSNFEMGEDSASGHPLVSSDGHVISGASGDSTAHWTPQMGVQSLGTLPGDGNSQATAMTPDASVIVGVSGAYPNIGAYRQQAFVWTPDSGMVGLGFLAPDDTDSVAYGVSANGSTVVGYSAGPTLGQHAFQWTSATGMVDLGPQSIDAQLVSADGAVVVGDAVNGGHFRWSGTTGTVPLGLPTGDSFGDAMFTSSDGNTIVGFSSHGNGSNTVQQIFRWTPDNGMTGLGSLAGENSPLPAAITPDGSVVVGSSWAGQHMFRWSAATGIVSLGSGFPTAVSNDGSIMVGTSSAIAPTPGTDDSRVFIWDPLRQHMFSLQGLLTKLNLMPGTPLPFPFGSKSEYVLDSVTSLSADGLTVTGTAHKFLQGTGGTVYVYEATLPDPSTWPFVSVPEPSAFTLAALGAIALVLFGRWRRRGGRAVQFGHGHTTV